MNNQTKKFFIYTRKSTDDKDRQVRSISDQLSELKDLALKEQLEVIDVFVEKQTAKIPGRPVFNEMMSRMEAGEASGILAWHPDRLARNSVDGGQIIYLVDTGVIQELKFPTFWFDPTPQGKFMLSIAFGQSKYYQRTWFAGAARRIAFHFKFSISFAKSVLLRRYPLQRRIVRRKARTDYHKETF